MKDNNKAVNIMVEENYRLIKQSIDSAKINRTVYGRVIESLGSDKYKAMINGEEYVVKSHWVHNVNDIVVIVVCNNNWKQLYIIY